jgi:hypothetical protein
VFLLAFVEVLFQYYKQPSSNIIYLHRFEEPEAPGSRSFFTEIIASISDIKFARDGRHILSRDYMTLKVSAYIIAKILVHNFSLNLLQVFWIHIFIGVKVYYIKLAS